MLPHPVCPTDEVQYYVYTGGSRDDLDAQRAAAAAWLATVFPFLRGYIWQRDGFELAIAAEDPPHLCGTTRFGDNLADEWFIVFLLLELSRHFPDWVVTVSDDDGQLLLIEAAQELPDWLEPETCENRVFLYRGQLHIIPPNAPFLCEGNPLLAQGLDWIRSLGPSGQTLAPPKVHACIERKLASYPQTALISNFHNCRVLLPEPLALVLHVRPEMVARAVTAFYYREPREAGRVLRQMARFDPSRSRGLLRSVRFSRCLFAQLLHQQFQPPVAQKFVIPAANDPLYKAASLGMKLTCGFELLCAIDEAAAAEVDALLRGQSVGLENVTDACFDDDEGWMLVSPAEVNDLLAAKESEVAAELNKAVDWMDTFVGHQSGLEGAEFPEPATGDVVPSFDVEHFLRALQHGLDLAEMEGNPTESMDEELAAHEPLSGDFERAEEAGASSSVDVELNLVTNMLKGMEAAHGEAGPMTTLLSQLREK